MQVIPLCSQCGNDIEDLILFTDSGGTQYWCTTCVMKDHQERNMIPSLDDDDEDPQTYFDNLMDTYEEKWEADRQRFREEDRVKKECDHEWESQDLVFKVVEYCRFCNIRKGDL